MLLACYIESVGCVRFLRQIVLQTQFSWTLVTSKVLSCGQAFQ